MRGRRVFSLCALLLSASMLVAQQTPSAVSTVDDLVRTGIANNRDLAAVRERVVEAKGLARQAGVRPAPILGLNGVTGKPLGTIGEEQYGGELSDPIETFGKRGKRIRVAEFSFGLAEAEFQGRTTELAYEIKAAYAEVLAERRKVKLLSDLMAFNSDTLKLTEARVKEGDVAPLEAGLLRVEVSQAEVSRMSAQSRLTSAEFELRRLAGLSDATSIPDVDFPVPKPLPLDALQEKALENRADLKSARIEEEQQAAGVALAKAEFGIGVNSMAELDERWALSLDRGLCLLLSVQDNTSTRDPPPHSVVELAGVMLARGRGRGQGLSEVVTAFGTDSG